MKRQELNEWRSFLSKGRFSGNDMEKLKRIYRQVADPNGNLSIVDWTCPSCVRRAIEIINNKLNNIDVEEEG